MDFVMKFFNNLWYTSVSIIFIFFIKRWYYKFINNELHKYKQKIRYYFIAPYRNSNINVYNVNNMKLVKRTEIIEFNGDLRLRFVFIDDTIYLFTINAYNIPFNFHLKLIKRFLKNYIINKCDINLINSILDSGNIESINNILTIDICDVIEKEIRYKSESFK